MNTYNLAVATFRRPKLLKLLLQDVASQTLPPETIVVVDGDPSSGEVSTILEDFVHGTQLPTVIYLPSNHSNLSYQRYLAWKVARRQEAPVLVYLDDDLRLRSPHTLETLIAPLFSDCSQVVGCTGEIRFGGLDNIPEAPVAIRDRHAFSRRPQSLLVRALGSSLGKLPGSLTPSGQRCKPDRGDSLTAEIEWLRGGVMACRLSALENDCFSQDLFALSEIGCGHGEDTLLSRRLLSQGKLLMVFDAVFDHPNADVPKAYCTKAFKMGWGISYSRRLLNDNYRWPKPPTIQDRLALWKSYVGNSALCILRAIGSCKVHRFAFAQGYLMGALQGIVRPPRHFRLTPHIDWQLDAEVAVSHRTSIRNRA